MKYRLAIDETGSFTMMEGDNSFVCGVAISNKEQTIIDKYKLCYEKFGLVPPASNDNKFIISNETFHFSGLTKEKRDICRQELLPLVDKIYISKSKPALYANNQNWWLIAVMVVIFEFLKSENFDKGDNVEVLIDNRSDKTLGLVEDGQNEQLKTEEQRYKEWREYHDVLKNQILANINKIAKAYGINIEIQFTSDTCSYFVNLADVVCGLVRQNRDMVNQQIIECPCYRFMSGDNPVTFVKSNPMNAVAIVFQEIANDNLQNVGLIDNTMLKAIAADTNSYLFLWDMFYDLIKAKIKERATNSNLVKLKSFVEIFLDKIKNDVNLPAPKRLDLMNLFMEYYSHIGSDVLPFNKDMFFDVINTKELNSETRLLRKWEKYVSYSLRESQILFNNYNFLKPVANLENIWGKQEKLIAIVPNFIDNNKDEPIAAITGTLAQAYAYSGNYEGAIEYFEISKSFTIKSFAQTDFYLFSVYHLQQNIEKAYLYFEKQTGKTPEEYVKCRKLDKNWELLSYCKLRALELYKNKTTHLPTIDLKNLQNNYSEYPFPLIQKWTGIALYLENAEINRQIIEINFTEAINSLLNDDNGFTIKTLALPIIQCFAVVNKKNQFHAEYNKLVADLKRQSSCFCKYIDNNAVLLSSIKNDADIWTRAISLPFIYS